MRIIGIDPGKKGGFALAEKEGVVMAELMPDSPYEIAELIRSWEPSHVYLEKAQAFRGQGVSSTFAYGDSYGQLKGIIYTLGIPLTLVRPTAWCRVMHKGTKAGAAKARSKEAAINLFPKINFKGPKGGWLDGIADACLIADFGRLEQLGGR